MRSNGPADNQAIEAVDDGREVHLASRDLELGDIRKPLFVRGSGLKIAVDEVFRSRTDFSEIGAVPAPLWPCNDQAFLFHQPLHDLF